MSNGLLTVTDPPTFEIDTDHHPDGLLDLLERRRSIRRLRYGPFPAAARRRILEAIRLTPAAFNLPSRHIVLIHAERAAFWRTVEAGFRERLDGDRLQRYLDRLDGFRNGIGVALVFEDVAVRGELARAWNITEDQARSYAEQELGMAQLSLWLALTNEGLVTSLQHWEWLIGDRITEFANVPLDRYRLVATLPIGYPDEPPRVTEPVALHRVVSHDRYPTEQD